MGERGQSLVVLDELGADVSDQHRVHGEPLEEIHRWVSYVPFGGHLLLICACGCPGPFVLSEGEATHVQCGVALAWRDGSARRAICGDAEVQRLGRAGSAV